MSVQAPIVEVFHSIQGEGKYVGVPQVFVRLAGCNLDCAWCDSRGARDMHASQFKAREAHDVWAELEKISKGYHSVSVTGGEPLLHAQFIKEFFSILKIYKIKTYLETNGTLPAALKEVIEDVDIISMDIKLPSSTKCPAFWKEHVDFLRIAWGKDVFIKTVVSEDTLMEDIVLAVEMICKGDPTMPLFLQPNHFEISDKLMDKCSEFQTYCLNYLSDVRVMPQMHKFMNLR